MNNNQEVTSRGIAQQSGLDIFCSITNYTGEFLSMGNPLLSSNIDVASDHATTAADPQLDTVTTLLPTGNIWFKYHTSGAPYTNIGAPSISGNYVQFRGHKADSKNSYSGICQGLSGLTVGKKYQIEMISPYSTVEGTLTVKTYSKAGGDVIENSSKSFTMPNNSSSMTTEFTAVSENDIVLIDYTTETGSAVVQYIYSITISEVQEYLAPIYVQDRFGNAHKTLRRNLGNTVSDD